MFSKIVNFFRSKRYLQEECSQLRELARLYKKDVEMLEKLPKEVELIPVTVPKQNDKDFFEALSALTTNRYYVYFLYELRKNAVEEFQHGNKDLAEFYRGKLAAYGKLIEESAEARNKLEYFNSEETENV